MQINTKVFFIAPAVDPAHPGVTFHVGGLALHPHLGLRTLH